MRRPPGHQGETGFPTAPHSLLLESSLLSFGFGGLSSPGAPPLPSSGQRWPGLADIEWDRDLKLRPLCTVLEILSCCLQGSSCSMVGSLSPGSPRRADAIIVVGNILGTSLFHQSPQLWLLGLHLKLFQEMACSVIAPFYLRMQIWKLIFQTYEVTTNAMLFPFA